MICLLLRQNVPLNVKHTDCVPCVPSREICDVVCRLHKKVCIQHEIWTRIILVIKDEC
jgi:hypothetical protein